MKTLSRVLAILAVLALILGITGGIAGASTSKTYPNVTLSGGFQAGHFDEVWSLAACDMTVSLTYDANGLVDDAGAHAWSEFGVRALGYGDFNPTWESEGAGVWLATDYDWTANTFDPDPVGAPTLDLDDKLILQKGGGWGEKSYNLPSTPPNPWANHAVWFDRDGVDQWQALMWGAIDGVTYNTAATYDVVITLHADSSTSGTAYMTINGEPQGFYVPNWHSGPADLMPAGMTFTGDMKHMQIFYGLYGYGATHTVAFEDIAVSGCLQPTAEITSPEDEELVFGLANFDATYSDDDPSGVQWAVRYGTCAAATNTVWGNVDGHNDPFTWDGSSFHSEADTSTWTLGDYCFVFNSTEGPGEDDIRLTRWFKVVPLPVEIDIKPGSYPNSINLGSKGVVPVAIFSTDEFDATTVIPDSIRLGGAGVAIRGKGTLLFHEEDINGDGLMDIVVQVNTADLGFTANQGEAILTGETTGGLHIMGTDTISIVKPE